MAAMAAMFVRSQKVVSVGSSFRTSRFNILRWGDEAVFGAVNLERRSVVGQPCRWLKRAAPKKALTPDKLAAVGTILFGAASPATILRSNKSVSIQAISERTYNKCQTGHRVRCGTQQNTELLQGLRGKSIALAGMDAAIRQDSAQSTAPTASTRQSPGRSSMLSKCKLARFL
ncbi:uncharacterized protein LOC120842617 isoform X2 [Ixodes scapularis]|uniref:uncharacterized protein LOC120842617 isoform X2 n=1 Tax=Ixodes scapularis TaxID=6945 RepID=UPI001C3849E0|nr:uncharacterized protein LOC120842617 isoform X2 [Ixodes scapularis]